MKEEDAEGLSQQQIHCNARFNMLKKPKSSLFFMVWSQKPQTELLSGLLS